MNAFRSLVLCGAVLLASAAFAHAAPKGQPAKESGRADVLYTCACGPECHCTSASTRPGNCTCGKPLKGGHVVKVEGTAALVCMCGEKCKCRIDPKDATLCGCGQALKRVELKGTGLYFCNCGGSCACNTLSAEPGTCGCGMALKQAL